MTGELCIVVMAVIVSGALECEWPVTQEGAGPMDIAAETGAVPGGEDSLPVDPRLQAFRSKRFSFEEVSLAACNEAVCVVPSSHSHEELECWWENASKALLRLVAKSSVF
jgi:hypothetical protein